MAQCFAGLDSLRSRTQLPLPRDRPHQLRSAAKREVEGNKVLPTVEPGTLQEDAAPHGLLDSLARKSRLLVGKRLCSASLLSAALLGRPRERCLCCRSGSGRPLAASLCTAFLRGTP